MEGSATFTIAMSSTTMNCTAQRSASANHFFCAEATMFKESFRGSEVSRKVEERLPPRRRLLRRFGVVLKNDSASCSGTSRTECIPGDAHVVSRRPRVSNPEAQHEAAVQPRVG